MRIRTTSAFEVRLAKGARIIYRVGYYNADGELADLLMKQGKGQIVDGPPAKKATSEKQTKTEPPKSGKGRS